MPKDLTLEINAGHPTILNLNTLRKAEPEAAREVSQVFLDSVMASSNVPFDAKSGATRIKDFIGNYLGETINVKSANQGATRRTVEAEFETIRPDDEEVESILSQASRDIRGSNPNAEKKVVAEHKVTGHEQKDYQREEREGGRK